MTKISTELIREALRQNVIDPEIGINVVDMGLIYDIKFEAGIVFIKMTLTSIGCPDDPYLMKEVIAVSEKVTSMPVHLDLVWDPAWNKDMMSQEAKDELLIVQ